MTVTTKNDTSSSSSTGSNNMKTTSSSLLLAFEPETVQPEWLELPPEIQAIDFRQDGAVVAWDKYQPYSDVPPILTPLGTPPTFSVVSPSTTSTATATATATTTTTNDNIHKGSSSDGSPHQRALCFHLHAIDGRARAGTIHFPNSAPPVPTPRFMPVGTKGTLKGVLPEEIGGGNGDDNDDDNDDLNCPMILANTYHLALQPGTELIHSVFGGLPNFMGGQEAKRGEEDAGGNKYPNDDEKQSKQHPPQKKQRKEKGRRLFNLLTDSGGFQMVSLAALSVVTENGVTFQSPYSSSNSGGGGGDDTNTNTNTTITLRPEDSIRCQNEIGADVIMQLDDVISSVQTDDARFRLATLRTLRWYDRCVQAHTRPESQNLYPILQGHLDVRKGGLREICLAGFRHRDILPADDGGDKDDDDGNDNNNNDNHHQKNKQGRRRRSIPGFAIGGLAGGESKEEFWKVVDHACRHLPDDRPRYLMGVGYPLDLVICTALGVDQYDCVYPTRTARFGVALIDGEDEEEDEGNEQGAGGGDASSASRGQLKLKRHEFATQHDRVILPGCPCAACSRNVSRARLHALLKSSSDNSVLGVQLLTQHNVCYMMGLVTRMRTAILEQRFPDFVRDFLRTHFGGSGNSSNTVENHDGNANVPPWVKDALHAAGIDLTNNITTTTANNNK